MTEGASQVFALEPLQGWAGFSRVADLEHLLWKRLSEISQGGIWHYYNFTTESSIWSADRKPDSNLVLTYQAPFSAVSPVIVQLGICLTEEQSEHATALSSLVDELTAEFGLIRRPLHRRLGSFQ